MRTYGDDYRRLYAASAAQHKVLRNVVDCRTARLGGHVDRCDTCSHVRIAYNSCRDRHCPKCQGAQRAEWLAQRLKRLLPVPYFHVVFTLPHELNPVVLRNPRRCYKLLFAAASRTLLQVGRDPKHLGAQIGITAVLHTWGQNLLLHPHLHCVVTGGGLASDETWVATAPQFFAPVRVLGRLYRGKFLASLRREHEKGTLKLPPALEDPAAWSQLINTLYEKDWVVYAKPPFGGPEQVFKYLGRYTHRVAISNQRILDIAHGKVTFSLRDYAQGARRRRMTLDAVEFLRRFLLHVLPHGFVRIRHYGLFASTNVPTKLALARALFTADPEEDLQDTASREPLTWWEKFREITGVDVMQCPHCGTGRLQREEILPPSDRYSTDTRASPRAG